MDKGTGGSDRNAKQDLRLTDERLKLLVDNVHDYAIIILDPQGRVLEWQGGAEGITGFATGDWAGEKLDVLFTPEDRRAGVPERELELAALHGKAPDKRWHQRKDGSRFFADGVTTALYGDSGKLRGFGKVFRDATAQQQAEEALRSSEERLRFALRAGRMGTWSLNVKTQELSCSETCKANFGRAPHESLTYDELAASVLLEDRPRWRRSIEAAISRGAEIEIECRVRWPDHTLHWVHVRAGVGADAPPRNQTLSGVTLNIDDRKGGEERLRLLDTLSEATRGAGDPATIMKVTTRLLGTHLRATRCAYADVEANNDTFTIRDDWSADGADSSAGVYTLDLFGSRAARAMRAGMTLVVRDVDRELRPNDGAETFRSIGVQAIVCCPLVKDGRLLAMMAVHQSERRQWTDEEIALVGQVVERSWAHIERARAAEELRDQDRRKDEFLATLAHELRNPLAPILAGIEVLRLHPTGDRANRAREVMARQLGHMVRLIDDLLDVSRISRGKLELRREPVSIAAVLEHALEASRPMIDAAHHQLEVQLPERTVRVFGDLTRLAQVMSNLLNNAAKYTPDGGLLQLQAQVVGDEVVVRIQDDGAGISNEKLPEIFDLFAQVNRTLHQAQGGLGIGLSLARRLVEMHGGSIAAESPGIGQGSTFTVRLPTIAQNREAHPEENPGHPAAEPLTAQRVLVVDDNVDAAELLATMMELSGHVTRTAHDGSAAIAAAREFLPHVIFLDLGLPIVDGYQAARQIREDPRLRDVVLIALTGWGGADDKRRTREAGFDHHVTKPVDVAAVDRILRAAASKSSRARA